jgi:hypothetical protein
VHSRFGSPGSDSGKGRRLPPSKYESANGKSAGALARGPPAQHRMLSDYPDPHVFQHDRLNLDDGVR